MTKLNLRSLGRLLAGLTCVVGLTLATGCSQKCAKGDCQKTKCTKNCDKPCDKPCEKKAASATKCPANCDKPCCKKA